MAKVNRSLRIQCGDMACTLLCEAISNYACSAFPAEGSECAQAARETLLTSVENIRQQHTELGYADIRIRQRRMIQAAVKWYFGENMPGTAMQDYMLALLAGKALTDDTLPV